jgi:hypothetical protein
MRKRKTLSLPMTLHKKNSQIPFTKSPMRGSVNNQEIYATEITQQNRRDPDGVAFLPRN